jgi:GDP-D-mannose dehydratase
MKKKIALIFGVTGQDGSYLAELLIKLELNMIDQNLMVQQERFLIFL